MAQISVANIKKPETNRKNTSSKIQETDHSQSIFSPSGHILFLQRTVGNQAVGKLIRSGVLQAKLRIGQPGDKYELEADRVADQIMKMPEVSKEEVSDSTPEVSSELESSISAINGGGQPLPEPVRAFYEPRFGHDFSQVRLHTDAKAAKSAQVVNAKAFTAGKNVVFGTGEYAPGTTSGKRLIAHELAHVMQQDTATEIRRENRRAQPAPPASNVIPCPNPDAVRSAISQAGTIISSAIRQMANGPSSVPEDPRSHTPMHNFYMLFFKVEPGMQSNRQILQIKENFRFLQQALSSVGTQCASSNHPDCRSGGMLHNAFAEIGVSGRLINFCPSFFNSGADEQARTIIHELAHNRLGVGHSGGRFLNFGCGATPVATFDEAIDNAYVYDNFAVCLHAAATPRRRGRQAP